MTSPLILATTTRLRVSAAVVFAFVFPPVGLTLFSVFSSLTNGPQQIVNVMTALPGLLFLSVIVGWTFVLPACLAWAVLHQFDRHYYLVAALVGLVTGGAFAALLASFGEDAPQAEAIFPVSAITGIVMALGVTTALGVWWIAYGRQDRLPKPIITRPQLSL